MNDIEKNSSQSPKKNLTIFLISYISNLCAGTCARALYLSRENASTSVTYRDRRVRV